MTSQGHISPGSLKKEVPLKMTPSKKTILQIKAKNTQLQKEMKALSKAEEVDLRTQQAKEVQFRTKYGKYLTRGNFETSLVKNDGFKRVAKETCLSNANHGEHVPLHKLIYTNGEVDVEKVVCLHLLSVQNISTFIDKRSFKLFPKRSKPNILEASALPFYIVEIIQKVDTELKRELTVGEDIIILVNSHLEKLIISILEVLAIVSPQKLQEIKELAFNKKSIQEIMIKTKIFNFLAQVKECPVITKMENYRLEIAQYQVEPLLIPHVLSVCRIRVKDKSKKLDFIQTEIKHILATYTEENVTSNDSWLMCHRKLCNCRKISSKRSVSSGNAIALLTEEGREFAVVTGAGCRLPTDSSLFCPSLTAIIKSSPRHKSYNIADESNVYPLHQRGASLLKNNEQNQNKLISSLLHKVNNSQRILIGKKAAEFKSQNIFKDKLGKQRTPINKIMEKVFSKQSLISFASTTENEELKLLFQPCCRGGLGIGSFILEPKKVNSKKLHTTSLLEPTCQFEDGIVPQIMNQEKSVMNTAHIKQDIFTSETRTKMKQFLLSDNPGRDNTFVAQAQTS